MSMAWNCSRGKATLGMIKNQRAYKTEMTHKTTAIEKYLGNAAAAI